MKSIAAILMFSALAAGCSHSQNAALQNMAAQFKPAPQTAVTVTTGSGQLAASAQNSPAVYSTNSKKRARPALPATSVWSTNRKVAPPAPIPVTSGNAASGRNNNSFLGWLFPGTQTGVAVQNPANSPAVNVTPNGTVVTPTTSTPGGTITPNGMTVTPATGK